MPERRIPLTDPITPTATFVSATVRREVVYDLHDFPGWTGPLHLTATTSVADGRTRTHLDVLAYCTGHRHRWTAEHPAGATRVLLGRVDGMGTCPFLGEDVPEWVQHLTAAALAPIEELS